MHQFKIITYWLVSSILTSIITLATYLFLPLLLDIRNLFSPPYNTEFFQLFAIWLLWIPTIPFMIMEIFFYVKQKFTHQTLFIISAIFTAMRIMGMIIAIHEIFSSLMYF